MQLWIQYVLVSENEKRFEVHPMRQVDDDSAQMWVLCVLVSHDVESSGVLQIP